VKKTKTPFNSNRRLSPADSAPRAAVVTVEDEARLVAVAAALAAACEPPFMLFLSGELGAGKTTFARALLRAAGVGGDFFIKSPAFALVESYDLPNGVAHHFDFFRLQKPREWRDAGIGEYLSEPRALCLVEWPERAADLPPADLSLRLEFANNAPAARVLRFAAGSEKGANALAAIGKK
jgi:tRNA threonylcarbamoyladenosine biosynthesis protein TsaE